MKKILSVLVLSFFAITMNAQNAFVNAGFESWSGSIPSNWNTLSAPIIGAVSSITKSTNAHSGSFAVKISSKKLPIAMPGITTAPGFLTNASVDFIGLTQLDMSNLDLSQLTSVLTDGTLITEKPTKINGYYSWSPVDEATDQFLLATLVISNTSGTREVIGTGLYTTTDISGFLKATYTSFESEIVYVDPNAVPTELIFLAITMNTDSNATSYGNLLLDDVLMTTTIGLEKITNDTKAPLVIYPNPTSGEFRLNVKSKVEVSVYNQLGQVVVPAMDYAPNSKISVKERGIYYVRVKDSNGTKTQKLIVK